MECHFCGVKNYTVGPAKCNCGSTSCADTKLITCFSCNTLLNEINTKYSHNLVLFFHHLNKFTSSFNKNE